MRVQIGLIVTIGASALQVPFAALISTHMRRIEGRHSPLLFAGGKLEFTLIGDTVNVAARVEQLTKTTGDAILLTQQCVDGLASRPPGLIDRGFHVLKGKSAAVQVFGLDQEAYARVGLTS